MKKMLMIFAFGILLMSEVFAQVHVIAPTDGINIPRYYAQNGSNPQFSTLGNLVISESVKTDFSTSGTLILNTPGNGNWVFDTGANVTAIVTSNGTPSVTASVTSITPAAITIQITVNMTNKVETLTIGGIGVQAVDGNITALVSITSSGTAGINGLPSNLIYLSLDPSTPLPVELTSFTASVSGNSVNLNWNTSTEVKNFGFDVERSITGKNWTKIDFVKGAGTSNSPKDYTYTDKSLNTGNYSYRLKQIDTDGGYTYSKIVEVRIGSLVNGYSLNQNYPNPFNPTTSINFVFANNTNASLKVYNSIGQEVATLFQGIAEGGRQYDLSFNASKLTSGVYFYKLEGNGKSEVKKMLLMK